MSACNKTAINIMAHSYGYRSATSVIVEIAVSCATRNILDIDQSNYRYSSSVADKFNSWTWVI